MLTVSVTPVTLTTPAAPTSRTLPAPNPAGYELAWRLLADNAVPCSGCPRVASPPYYGAAPARIETWREAWGLADTLMREGWRATETLAFCPECAPGADWEGEDY